MTKKISLLICLFALVACRRSRANDLAADAALTIAPSNPADTSSADTVSTRTTAPAPPPSAPSAIPAPSAVPVDTAQTETPAWEGRYAGFQGTKGTGGVNPVIGQTIIVRRRGNALFADISADGTQTATRIEATADDRGDELVLRFEAYGKGDVYQAPRHVRGDDIGHIVRQPDGKLVLRSKDIPMVFPDKDEPLTFTPAR